MKETHLGKAMFVDEVDIVVIGGAGGDGCVAFRRERFVPHGGPSGGNGGDGGSVYLLADPQYNTLQHLAGHHHWRAERGVHGQGKDCHGKRGKDLHVPVPPGTIIRDVERGIILKDLATPGESICVAAGGNGGKGNTAFKSPTLQAPRIAEPGEPGQQRHLHLELKLMADVGLVGLPNAGKSTLISRCSHARPKIAAYPFTTLHPSLGIVELSGERRFVMADIPGLIAGAHTGAGLGDEFLRHVERTRVLVHVIDIVPPDRDPVADYRAIRAELEQYSSALAAKPEIIAANKMDLTGADQALAAFRRKIKREVVPISGATGRGIDVLTERVWALLAELQRSETAAALTAARKSAPRVRPQDRWQEDPHES